METSLCAPIGIAQSRGSAAPAWLRSLRLSILSDATAAVSIVSAIHGPSCAPFCARRLPHVDARCESNAVLRPSRLRLDWRGHRPCAPACAVVAFPLGPSLVLFLVSSHSGFVPLLTVSWLGPLSDRSHSRVFKIALLIRLLFWSFVPCVEPHSLLLSSRPAHFLRAGPLSFLLSVVSSARLSLLLSPPWVKARCH